APLLRLVPTLLQRPFDGHRHHPPPFQDIAFRSASGGGIALYLVLSTSRHRTVSCLQSSRSCVTSDGVARELTTLGEALRAGLARLRAGRELASFPIWTEWADVVGAPIARHARPRRLRRGVLVVEVDGAEWMHELQYLKQELRGRLNERLG